MGVFTGVRPRPPSSVSNRGRRRRPEFRGSRQGGSQGELNTSSVGWGSGSDDASSLWMCPAPQLEVEAAPSPPAHQNPKLNKNQSTVAVANREKPDEGNRDDGGESNFVPSSVLTEIRVRDARVNVRAAMPPRWGCFCPVILPPEGSGVCDCVDAKNGQGAPGRRDGDRGSAAAVGARFFLKSSREPSRVREQASRLSADLREMLQDARARANRRKLSEAANFLGDRKPDVLKIESGAQMGLEIISALEGVVAFEGEVFGRLFGEFVGRERKVCRQRGELLEVMRGHYASLLQDVVDHLSGLRRSLRATVSQEELLKQQARRVQRLAANTLAPCLLVVKLLAQDAKSDHNARRELASTEPTELERYVENQYQLKIAVDAGVNEGSRNDENNRVSCLDPSSQIVESRPGLLSEVLSEAAEAAPGFAARTELTRHVNAAAKMDMLQDMIEERVAVRRMTEREEKWNQYNAATVIKNWWRQVNPPEWEEGDRQYAATLIQAHARSTLARIMLKRSLEALTSKRGAITLQTLFRRFLAAKERRKRARIVEVALGAGLRTLGQAVGELEAKVSGLPETVEQGCRNSSGSSSGRTSTVAANPSTRGPEDVTVAAAGVEGSKTPKETVSALVQRLKTVGHVLEKREKQRGGAIVSDSLSGGVAGGGDGAHSGRFSKVGGASGGGGSSGGVKKMGSGRRR